MVRLCLLCVLLSLSAAVSAKTWYVGILAPQGAEAARAQWQPWLDWLGSRRPADQFVLVPLALGNWQQELTAKRVDFALGPQAQFVVLPDTEGWRWLATARFPSGHRPRATEQVGSTIWVRQDAPWRDERDLRGKRIAAVDAQAFGGFMLAEQLLLQHGLRQGSDYRPVFTGYPIEQTVEALHRGEVDAAIAPLCLMEEWRAQQGLPAEAFRPLSVRTTVNGCVSGTPVFPHWILAALPSVSEEEATHMMGLLFGEPPAEGMPGWSPPVSFVAAEQVLAELGRHPLHPSWQSQGRKWLQENKLLAGALGLVVLISLINYAWMSWLAYRRRKKLEQAHRQLRERDRLLAHTDRLNIAGEMAAGLAHELNQPMAAIRHYAEGGLHLLDSGNGHDAVRRALANIIQTTERGSGIIRNLRQWVKTPEHVYAEVAVEDMLRRCADWLACQKDPPRLYWRNDSGQTHMYTVASIVEQVMMNCLLNSQQQGVGQVEMIVEKAADGGWVIRIEDDGGGFDEAVLAQPFVPFRSSKHDGLGLGLAICDRLLRSIGGSLHLSNRSGAVSGARAEIRLPERKEHA